MEIDPANPLHKLLPETDCEFCLETREKLWGMMKGMKKPGAAKAKDAGAPPVNVPPPSRGPESAPADAEAVASPSLP